MAKSIGIAPVFKAWRRFERRSHVSTCDHDFLRPPKTRTTVPLIALVLLNPDLHSQGPCGEAFKESFSCFVASKEAEKGSDCIAAFTKLHECFDAHPEILNKGDSKAESVETEQAKTEQAEQTKQ